MTPSEGRSYFFGVLAEQLQQIHPGELPPQVALRFPEGDGSWPQEDRNSLAVAFCKMHATQDDNVVNVDIGKFTGNLNSCNNPIVINAQNLSLKDAISIIKNTNNIPRTYTITGYTSGEFVGAVAEINFDPENDEAHLRIALERLLQSLGRTRPDSLILPRLQKRGFRVLEHDYSLFGKSVRSDWGTDERISEFCSSICSGWRYRDHNVNPDDVFQWLDQFRADGFIDEASQLLHYLRLDGFVSKGRIIRNILKCFECLPPQDDVETVAISIQPQGKSEGFLAYDLRKRISLNRLSDVFQKYEHSKLRLVCFDDFVGSGQSMQKYLFNEKYNDSASPLMDRLSKGDTEVVIVVSHADSDGISNLTNDKRGCGRVSIHANTIVADYIRVFNDQCNIISDPNRKQEFRQFCLNIGTKIYKHHPLGWEGRQWCMVSEYSVPNCSLPVLFAYGEELNSWKPLFPRERITVRRTHVG